MMTRMLFYESVRILKRGQDRGQHSYHLPWGWGGGCASYEEQRLGVT